MTDGVSGDGVFPVVVVTVNGVKCRALIDSGAGGSYASAKLIKMIDSKPIESRVQRVDMLLDSKTTRMEFYDTEVRALDGNFKMNVRMAKVETPELLTINNPDYEKLIRDYNHLGNVVIDDCDTKDRLPIHSVLGNGEYARIKTSTKPVIGGDHEPVAEKTKLGWFIMSPGIDFDRSTMLLTQTAHSDFESLCRLDVLGLADTMENDQNAVYDDIKETRDNLYVDDLITGGENVESVAAKRSQAVEVLQDATFKLHKWHSSDLILENHNQSTPANEDEITYAKEQLGSGKCDTKLLGLPWNKIEDTVSIVTSPRKNIATKREALSDLSKIYDPLGSVSPTTLIAKILYREMCEARLPWYGELCEAMKRRWEEWGALISKKCKFHSTYLGPSPPTYNSGYPPCLR